MITGAESVTLNLIKLALDTASMRQQVIATNIANVNSEGYRPLRVDFERQLGDAKALLLDRTQSQSAAEMLNSIEPVVFEDPSEGLLGKEGVRLDDEMTKMAQNTVHYQSLLEAVSRKLSLMRIAINGGGS